MSSIAIVLTLLAVGKIADFSMPKNFEYIAKQLSDGIKYSAETSTDTTNEEDETTAILNGVTVGEKYVQFEDGKYDYNIELPYDTPDLVKIQADKKSDAQVVDGLGEFIILDSKNVELKVYSADKSSNTTYKLNIKRLHSNYLKTLEVIGYGLNPEFKSDVKTYTLQKFADTTEVSVYATAYDKEANIKIQGNTEMGSNGTITITVSEPNVSEDMVYEINYVEASLVNNFSYTGAYEEFIVPFTGMYNMQCWGARGGASRKNGSLYALYGKGGYASGNIRLVKGEKYYIYVGGKGTDSVVGKDSPGGWNGGGLGTWDRSDNETSGGGGGATDIRLIGAEWNNEKSLRSRIIVAGGAGGTSWTYTPGNGGGISGTSYYSSVSPAGTQTSGYLFGIGRDAWGKADNDGVAGGGGGYYGGQTNNVSQKSSGAGGSGYVSGHPGCIAVTSEEDTTPKVEKYSEISDSYHYSGKIFTDTVLTAGNSTMPTWDGTSTMTGNQNPGYAKITNLSQIETEYPISNITVDNGVMTEKFNPSEYNYYVQVNKDNPTVNITFTKTSDSVTVENGETQSIVTNVGTNIKEVKVLDKDGIEYVYKIYLIREPSSYSYLKGISVSGQNIDEFIPENTSYTVEMPYYIEDTVVLDAIKGMPDQTIVGIGNVETLHNTTVCSIEVTSEDGTSTTIYNLTLNKVPTTKLKYMEIKNQEFAKIFESDKLEYEFEVTTGVVSLDITAIPYDENATVSIKGAGYIKEGKNTVTVTVSRSGIEDTVYTLYVKKGENLGEITYDYDYTGDYQEFVAPATGNYKFECWGASGGRSIRNGRLCEIGGLGGYTSGIIKLQQGDTFYVYVGGQGQNAKVNTNVAGGWNGGGSGTWDNRDDESAGGGGGATDIRIVSGEWNNIESLKNRVMVAGAGGGKSWTFTPGAGGGLSGNSHYSVSKPGTQTSGYKFGIGKNGWGVADSDGVAGGGAGYYGGETNNVSNQSSGAGGSSFISGHEGCDAISEDSTDNGIIHTGQSVHYSGIKFRDTVMIDGDGYEWTTQKDSYTKMEDPSGNFVNGKSGNGYARITLLEDPSENNLLKEIQINKGTLTPEVDYDTKDYTVELGADDTTLTVYGVVDDIKATVEGNGTYDILPGENTIELKVTAENGDVRIYTIKATRPASSVAKPINIKIDGLIESIISVNPIYGKLNPETFDADTHEYSMIVPSRIKKLTFEVEKGHPYQKVVGDGKVELNGGMNKITIEVTSEDGTNVETYTYNIERDMSGNCLLESLTINNFDAELDFDQEVLEYFVIVPNEITELDITAIPEIKTIVPQIIGNTNLKVGLNDVHILVTAENGEQLVYVIHAYRMMSGNTFLDYIKVSNGDTEFSLDPIYNKILDSYTVNVPNNVDSIVIDAKTEVATSSVSGIGEKKLNTGNNKFTLQVTAEDKSVGKYELLVVREKSNNNYLKKLECSNSVLQPEFNKETLEYSMTVDSSVKSLNLDIEKEDETSKVNVVGNNNFIVGDNEVIINVTAENGDVRTYKINVNRLASDNNNLLKLSTNYGNLSPEFNKDTTAYTVEVDNDIEIINVFATKEDTNATIVGAGKYALEVGENEVNVTVTAENGDIKMYTLKIIRKQSNNTNLLRIENDKSAVVNKKDDKTYTINVSNDVKKLKITAIPEKSTSKVTGNGEFDLVIGENNIPIKVVAEDGTEKDYMIIVTREKSNNANLSHLFVYEGGISPKFEKNTTEYALKVSEEVEKLTFDIITEDSEASYYIMGNSNFKFGVNKVYVVVTASDGKTTKYYNLTVYKQAQNINSNDLIALTVNKGTLTPTFDTETLVYDVELPYKESKITVDAVALDSSAIVDGLGEYDLDVGLNVISVKVTSTDGIEKTYQIRVTREKSNDARLSSLKVQGCTLNPIFDSDIAVYAIETDQSSINISAIPIELEASYVIEGNTNLVKGMNIVNITVTAPDGKTTKNYTIKATRTKSKNNNLASLRVVGYDLTPEFSKTNLVYTVNVENDVNSVMVEAIADDENATITGCGSVNLNTGKNTVKVSVTSEYGNVKEYTVIIYKKASDNNFLEKLEISTGTLNPVFDKTINSYEVEVDYETENIVLTGNAEDLSAKVTGFGKYDLNVGENNIFVKVVSEAGIENVYNVKVTRKEAVSAKLKNLSVDSYSLSPKFNMDTNEYNITVDNEITSLNLNIETLDPNATYVVSGNENFVVGTNTVKINVTSSDGLKTEEYILNVTRQLSSNNYLDYILVSEGNLNPVYNKTTLYYEVNVANDVTSINVDAEASDSKASVSGVGCYELETGENVIKLEVTSVAGIKRTYTIKVIRAKNSNNYLKDLVLKLGSTTLELNPIFNKETQEYNVTVEEGTTRVQILATPECDLSKVTGIGYCSVVAGSNIYEIKVQAEDGSIRTYKINLTRPKSSMNYLTELVPSVGVLSPSFDYNETNYTLTVGNLDSLLYFDVNTQNRFATVKGIEEQEIPDGESTRTIEVTAEDGSVREYVIKVIRNRTDDARLASLEVKSYTLDQEFDEDLFEYTLTVPNDKFQITENEIVAKPKYEESEVYLTPSIELSVLNINTYEITVTAPDGYTTQKYKINVTRQKSSDSSLSKLAVSGYEITPEFSSENTEYTLALPKGTSILNGSDVIAVPTDTYATLEKMDKIDLNNGENQYKIVVTSHDETTTTTYIINVENEKSANNYLDTLDVSPGTLSPVFDTNVVNYEVHVKKTQESINVSATTQDPTATIVSGTGTTVLTSDETQILVLVQGEDEKLRGYVIKVYRDLEVSTISGQIKTENDNQIYKATVKLVKDGNLKYEIETENDGTYSFEVDDGKYDLIIQKEGYLTYTVKNIEIENQESVEISEKMLLAGDINSDNVVEIDDLVALNEKQGISVNYADNVNNENSKYDFNEDGIIDNKDRTILKENYGKMSETVEWANLNSVMMLSSEAELESIENIDDEINSTEEAQKVENVVDEIVLEEYQKFIVPISGEYTVTSSYGTRIDPITGEEKKHTGIDISDGIHSEILAVADGEVVETGTTNAWGNYVEIKHEINGEILYSFYAHLSQVNVENGQQISQGNVIGLEGGNPAEDPNSGNSTGRHLHFEIRTSPEYGADVDPTTYIEF